VLGGSKLPSESGGKPPQSKAFGFRNGWIAPFSLLRYLRA
jgi:hypothetical protein